MIRTRFSTALAIAVVALAGCGEAPPEPAAESALQEAAPQDGVAPAAESGSGAPLSARFQLNTHYRRLSPTQPTSSSPEAVEVAEVFWYGCPHCATFDPYLAAWEARKADYINFVRIPAVWNPLVRLHARAFYTAEALGKGAEMHEAFFREIHVNRNALDTEEKLQEFFAGFGVDAAAFKTAFDSFDVHAKVQRADELNRRYEIASVPTIVINGKYVTDGELAGGYEPLLDLIDDLAATERGGG